MRTCCVAIDEDYGLGLPIPSSSIVGEGVVMSSHGWLIPMLSNQSEASDPSIPPNKSSNLIGLIGSTKMRFSAFVDVDDRSNCTVRGSGLELELVVGRGNVICQTPSLANESSDTQTDISTSHLISGFCTLVSV